MLVLDANILVRAVLGRRVRTLISKYSNQVSLLAPDIAFEEARRHLPAVLERRNVPFLPAMELLESLGTIVDPVDQDVYQDYEAVSRERLAGRDVDDWPVLALALSLGCAIWRMRTSSVAASRLGQQTGSRSISRVNSASRRNTSSRIPL